MTAPGPPTGGGVAAPAIEAAGAVVQVGEFRLGPVDLSVAPGRALAVIGPNGAGKSTLLRALAGLLPVAAGTIRLRGRSLLGLSRAAAARRVVLVAQQPATALDQGVLDVVLHGRWVHQRGLFRLPGPADLEAAHAALERVGAGHLAGRTFATLSGGEARRVLLAKALAQGGEVLLLDEPTASLDLRQRVAVAELIAGTLPGAGPAIVLATHDFDLAATACEHGLLLAAGRELAAGAIEGVLVEDLLADAFGQPVRVDQHPDTGRPRVTPRLNCERN